MSTRLFQSSRIAAPAKANYEEMIQNFSNIDSGAVWNVSHMRGDRMQHNKAHAFSEMEIHNFARVQNSDLFSLQTLTEQFSQAE